MDELQKKENLPQVKEQPIKEKEKNLHEGHRDRLRKRYVRYGFEGLAPHEVIELVLFDVYHVKDTNKIAHELIERFGSVSGVLDAPIGELLKVDGIGERAACSLSLYKSMINYYAFDKFRDKTHFFSYGEAKKYCMTLIQNCVKEEMIAVFLTYNSDLLSVRKWSGSPGRINASIREFVDECVRTGAAYVMMAHSHPYGSAAPSIDDLRFTKTLFAALMSIDVVLADHLIAGANEVYSFRDNDKLTQFLQQYIAEYNPSERIRQTLPEGWENK